MRMPIAGVAAAFLLFVGTVSSGAQEQPPFSLTVVPGFEIPFGPKMDASGGKPPYTLGFSADLVGEYRLPFSQLLVARASVGYCLLPVVNGETLGTPDLSLISFGLGPALSFSPVDRLTLTASLT